MGKFPWGRWFAVLKVAVWLPIFIVAAAIIIIIALFDPQKVSGGAGIIWFEYEAKTRQDIPNQETEQDARNQKDPFIDTSSKSHQRSLIQMGTTSEHTSAITWRVHSFEE